MLSSLQSHTDLSLLVQATSFAAHAHRGQRRKDGVTPYINHPLRLVEVLVLTGQVSDPVLLSAAVLHDVVEDCDVLPEEIETRFGPEVAAVVAEVSDDKSLPKAERKRLQVEHAPHMSSRARHLKLADKICNLTDILDTPPLGWERERKVEYFEWCARVVAGLRGTSPSLEMRFDDLYGKRLTL